MQRLDARPETFRAKPHVDNNSDVVRVAARRLVSNQQLLYLWAVDAESRGGQCSKCRKLPWGE